MYLKLCMCEMVPSVNFDVDDGGEDNALTRHSKMPSKIVSQE